jgi:bifunctional non-homologous end joining protein LigD
MTRTKSKGTAPMPSFIPPCLATLVRDPPDGDKWGHEIKFDGYRLQARIDNGAVRFLTRSGHDWTGKFASLTKPFLALGLTRALIDGEVVVQDDHGASSFVELVADLKAGRSARMTYIAFDLLFLNGTDVRKLPLADRKALLAQALKSAPKAGPLRYSDHMQGDPAAILTNACKLGLEGIISKRLDKPYHSGRHADWVKLKCIQSDEFVIAGYLDSTAIKDAIGALVLGVYDKKSLVYAGRVGTGFDRKTARELWQLLQPLKTATRPFSQILAALQTKGVTWVAPKLVAQIEYRAWTSDGILRHAAFKSLRDDKPAIQVSRPKVVSI